MSVNIFTTVSDSALCQKCPALLAYKIHRGFRNAWRIGIKGNGAAYGTIFHKKIARVFFEAASKPSGSLHRKIKRSLSGASTLESVIREDIFLPLLAAKSESFTSEQITAMAEGISVWVKAMSEFFALIPSLSEAPDKVMPTVFIKPEQKLQAVYEYPSGGGTLTVTGCYDALLFNPDRGEARLFEFKSYMKSDISVPLSQSLIYSWLIREHTGITPSVEIIYLSDIGKEPDVFGALSVDGMIEAGLPELFRSVFEVIALRNVPEFQRDLNLCRQCPFNARCGKDWR